jgi:S-adenosylmethionine hydrolase
MSCRLITLTTDFGGGSYYVGQMKGAIFLRNPDASVIDLSHDMLPHDVPAAAYWIHRATRLFPRDAIHVVVVDPGVGTRRDLVYCRTQARTFLGPDNGVLSWAAQRDGIEQIVRLSNTQLFHADVSKTFHGRDILAPVAAKLSLGASPLMLGEPMSELQPVAMAQPQILGDRIVGQVVFVDRFGNLISNVSRDDVEQLWGTDDQALSVQACDRAIRGLSGTYGDQRPGSLISIFDSDGFLEVAIVQGSAAQVLAAGIGASIAVSRIRAR